MDTVKLALYYPPDQVDRMIALCTIQVLNGMEDYELVLSIWAAVKKEQERATHD